MEHRQLPHFMTHSDEICGTGYIGFMSAKILYIDPDLSGRMKFRQVAGNEGKSIGSISVASTLLEGFARLDGSTAVTIVYLSSRFALPILKQFIVRVRTTKTIGATVFMVVLPGYNCDLDDVTNFALAEVDGFLLEPYSSDQLNKSLELANSALSRRKVSHVDVALALLIENARAGLSLGIRRMRHQRCPIKALTPLSKSMAPLKDLSEDTQKQFLNLLVEKLVGREKSRLMPKAQHSTQRRIIRAA